MTVCEVYDLLEIIDGVSLYRKVQQEELQRENT